MNKNRKRVKRPTSSVRMYTDNWNKIKIRGIKRGLRGIDMIDQMTNRET